MSSDKSAVSRNAGQFGEGTESSNDSAKQNTPPAKRSRLELDLTSMMEDFPIHSSNPFTKPFCGSDVVLVVEEKKLHAHKQILTLNCPYFRTLFGSQNFVEASAKEIELKDSEFLEIKYNVMVRFLLFLYPVHSANTIEDDRTLSGLFPLADYFQCQHVRRRCEAYIKQQFDRAGSYDDNFTKISADRALLYIGLCSKYRTDMFVDQLLAILARKRLVDVEGNEHFKSLSLEVQRNVLCKRAQFVEQRLNSQPEEIAPFFKKPVHGEYTCTSCTVKATGYHRIICFSCHNKLQAKLKP